MAAFDAGVFDGGVFDVAAISPSGPGTSTKPPITISLSSERHTLTMPARHIIATATIRNEVTLPSRIVAGG